MAQEKSRASRARKTTEGEPGAAAEQEPRPGARKTAAKAETKAAATKKTAASKATRAPAKRTRKPAVGAEPLPDAIAEHAYLLWERGEPGDQTEHWLRAEAELRTAA
jgi:hypothetical protein